MPKMFVHTSKGTFDAPNREKVAAVLTELGLKCERLPDPPFVRSGVWIYFSEHERSEVYNGGREAAAGIMSLVIFALEGGLDSSGKQELISGAPRFSAGIRARSDPSPRSSSFARRPKATGACLVNPAA
jgi:hypothetical protein